MIKKLIVFSLSLLFIGLSQAQLSYFLSNKFWRLKQANINGKQYNFNSSPNAPTLQISGGRIRGNGGCNAYHTRFTIDGTTLMIDQISSTKISCNDLYLNESEYFNALAQTHTLAHIEGSNEFKLYSTRGDVLEFYAQFEKSVHSYTPPPSTRRESVSTRTYVKKNSLSKKELSRKALLEKKLKKKKLTKAERRELIILQSKAKKNRVVRTSSRSKKAYRGKSSRKKSSRYSKSSTKKSSSSKRKSATKSSKKKSTHSKSKKRR